jgi:CubicO group peptidase (beta-lactamase class C family)
MKNILTLMLLIFSLGTSNVGQSQEKRDKTFPIPRSIDPNTPHKVGQFTNLATISSSCKVSKSDAPFVFKKNVRDLSGIKIADFTIKDYISKHNVMGFTVIRGDTIIDQQFRFERRESDLFTTMSVSKSIVGILVGIAQKEGFIFSLDDPVKKYAERVRYSAYGDLSIRSLLRMSSGVAVDEIYPVKPKTDGYDFFVEAMFIPKPSVISAINNVKKRSTGEGKVFNYASVETGVLAEVVRGATKQSLCQFMRDKLWQPIGAEYDAFWNVDGEGLEYGYGWLNVAQVDIAKVAMLLTNGGVKDGRQILSAEYIDEATNIDRQPQGFRKVNDRNEPEKSAGYGFQFWLNSVPGKYFMQGAFGQYVLIHNQSKTILVINSADNVHLNDLRTKRTLKIFDELISHEF